MHPISVSNHHLDFNSGFSLDFAFASGLSLSVPSTKRTLSQMEGIYADEQAYNEALKHGDPLVYEFYELTPPSLPGDLAFGTSIVYPGQVGGEYYMTKGHFHTILETAEVYYCLGGQGYMLTENPEGDWKAHALAPGEAVYVPKRWAHRTVNTGETPLITFFVFRADAGHDYGTIEKLGFRRRVVSRGGRPAIEPNPRWIKASPTTD